MKDLQLKQKEYYDRGTTKLKNLVEGEPVFFQRGTRKWIPGVRKHDHESNIINGSCLRRNRIHIRQRKKRKGRVI
jgi:hypothetical protein